MQVSAAEFVLEGLHAHKKIGRNEERIFTAGEKPVKIAEKPTFERDDSEFGGSEGSIRSLVVSRSGFSDCSTTIED